MTFKRKQRTRRFSKIRKFFRSMFAITTLTALVLGISYFVRGISTFTPEKAVAMSIPFLDKLGIEANNKTGEVAGESEQRPEPQEIKKEEPQPEEIPENLLFRIAIIADIHGDFDNLERSLTKVKELNIETVILPGDQTDLGLLTNLQKVKEMLDQSGITYYAIPGDHDLWKTVGPQNFLAVFGTNYHIIDINGSTVLMLDNSMNYTTIPTEQEQKFIEDVKTADFVILSQPLFHPSNRIMGQVNGEEVSKVKEQGQRLLEAIRGAQVTAVISADHHNSSNVQDPEKKELRHVVVGAITSERNLQSPRFGVLNIFKDETFSVEDVVLN